MAPTEGGLPGLNSGGADAGVPPSLRIPLSIDDQSARMSKITNDGLTRSDIGCFIAVPIRQQWVSKG